MRRLCGCRLREEAARVAGEPGEAEAHDALGRTLQGRWGCPRAGHRPPAALPPDLADAAEDYARVVRVPRPCSCPFAEGLSSWGRQVVSAHRLATRLKGAVPVGQALGRDPHVWDLRALDASLCDLDDVAESDDAVRERERRLREAAQQQPGAGPGPAWNPSR